MLERLGDIRGEIDRPTLTFEPEFRDSLGDNSLGISERQIATISKVYVGLACRLERDPLSIKEVLGAWEALKELVPHYKNGKVHIADKEVTPGRKKLIESRTKSQEIDIDRVDDGWCSLPSAVTKHLVEKGGIFIQLTRECTAGCHFCGQAIKSPITIRFSSSSLINFFNDWKAMRLHSKVNNQKITGLYGGSDPFDHPEYATIHSTFLDIFQGDLYPYISTAVPIGSELEILDLLMQVNDNQRAKFQKYSDSFRISTNNENLERIRLLKVIESGLLETPLVPMTVTVNRSDKPLKANGNWNAAVEELSLKDIRGTTCVDATFFSPTSSWTTVRVAASPEHPIGELKRPLYKDKNGQKVYRIPVFSVLNNDKKSIGIQIVEILPDDSFSIQPEHIPERSVHIIISTIFSLCQSTGSFDQEEMTKAENKKRFKEIVSPNELEDLASCANNGNKSAILLKSFIRQHELAALD